MIRSKIVATESTVDLISIVYIMNCQRQRHVSHRAFLASCIKNDLI